MAAKFANIANSVADIPDRWIS